MKHRICMASDFFYPNMGGVEEHIYNLSQCLIAAGHKVIILTHSYGDRGGVRYMTQGLKVFYLPIQTFYNQCVLPTMICSLPLIRWILVQEQITIVHGHSAFSALAHEAMLIGRLIGLKTIFTDHSLFGFADTSAVITNKFLEISLAGCTHCICVSHIGKENTVLRGKVQAGDVSVIPNAVDTCLFTPEKGNRPGTSGEVTIVVISRLVYRKGVDLLAEIIPRICAKDKKVKFLIGGDGPKREVVEEVREAGLANRVTMLGALNHSQVRSVLVQGQVFLNTSLTEAYCMAIVEAAACGLNVVSTNVGGIPEVLPPELIHLADPTVPALVSALERVIADYRLGRGVVPEKAHARVASLYNWQDVTRRTIVVYNSASLQPTESLARHLSRYIPTQVLPWLLVVALCHLILLFLKWIIPDHEIDKAGDLLMTGNVGNPVFTCQVSDDGNTQKRRRKALLV